MSRRIVFGLIAALVSAGAVVAASRPPTALRESVQAEFGRVLPDKDEGEPAKVRLAPAAMFQRVDVNGDGVVDWRIDYGKAPIPSYFCGTGGCRQQLWVSNPDGGYSLVFDRLARAFKLHRAKGQVVLDVDYHGTVCGGFGVDDCPRGYGWADDGRRFLERPSAGGQTFLFGGPARPLPPVEAALPATVRAAIEVRAAACRKIGGSYPFQDAYVTDVPDLNSDGVRDWIVGGPYDSCAFEDDIPGSVPSFSVSAFVSAPGGFSKAFEDHPLAWGLDLNGQAATFVTLQGAEDCGLNGAGCAMTRWRWNGIALVSKAAEQP
jgi:hypothetical protein